MFRDIGDLLNTRAKNVIDGRMVFVPFADAFACGFSCTSRSKANRNSAANLNCLQLHKESATTETFEGALSYIARARPAVVVLEHVRELEQREPAGGKSDADLVAESLRKLKYAATFVSFDAASYGSWSHRRRLCFLALETDSPANRLRLQQAQVHLQSMEIGPGRPEDFLLDDDELASIYGQERAAKRPREQDPGHDGYKQYHMQIFGDYDLEMPPALEQYSGIDWSGMWQRQQKAAYFYLVKFPAAQDGVDCVDLNESLQRGLRLERGDQAHSPWNPELGARTSTSRWMVRRAKDAESTARLLKGVEAMRGIGWDLLDWNGEFQGVPNMYTEDLLYSLAGNAFSAFAFGLVIACLLAAMCAPVNAPDCEPVVADCSGADSDNSSECSDD